MPEDADCRRLLHAHPDLAAVHQALASLDADRNADVAQALRRCTDELRTLRGQAASQIEHSFQRYIENSLQYSASFGKDAWSLEVLSKFNSHQPREHLISGKIRFQGDTPIIDLLKDDVRRLSNLLEAQDVLQPSPLPHHRAVWVEAKCWDDSAWQDGDVLVETSVHHLVIKPYEYARVHLDKAWSSITPSIVQHQHRAVRISLMKSVNDEDLRTGVPVVLGRPKTAGQRLLLPRWMLYVPAAFVEEPEKGEAHLRRRLLHQANMVHLSGTGGMLDGTVWKIDEQRNELQVVDGRRRFLMDDVRSLPNIAATLHLFDPQTNA